MQSWRETFLRLVSSARLVFIWDGTMPNYRRNFVAGGCCFFTVNFPERKRSLLTDHIDLLRGSVRRVKVLQPFHIDAWVVQPGHMHAIWTLPPDTVDLPVRWLLIKLLFSKGLPRTKRLSSGYPLLIELKNRKAETK
ncbi:MAG: transposase [Gammaproteobacteria bacterium]